MKIYGILFILLILTLACEPDYPEPYEVFTIKAGSHDAGWKPELLQSSTLRFEAIFDESAIYTSVDPVNQWDTNKLLGFSDCNSAHHENSARFGWRWLGNQLEIIAYCYADGVVYIEPIAAVPLNEPSQYELSITEDSYLFKLNDTTMTMTRGNACTTGLYYKLWPYFGGDEVAPHDITIKIKTAY